MKTLLRSVALLVFAVWYTTVAWAQNKDMSREEYIATYAPLAMEQQQKYGIPASIKLAQGLLESRNGNSDLCRESNNHFGIKCKSNWTGQTVSYDDDAPGECFRKYGTIEESYVDHSLFLTGSQRYAALFKLKPTDYKGWARGLKEAGYATAPHYATSLIKLIEDYELYLFDQGEYPVYLAGVEPREVIDVTPINIAYGDAPVDVDNFAVSVNTYAGKGIYSSGGRRYIVAAAGDSYKSLAASLGISENRLRRFNNARKAPLSTGDIVYIEKQLKSRS